MRARHYIEMTVCLLRRDDELMLALKTKKIGKGKRMPHGGNHEGKESMPECAARELSEEAGVIAHVRDLKKVCIAIFHNIGKSGQPVMCRVHYYVTSKWVGEIMPTETMEDPQWYNIDDLPYRQMMLADVDYFPLLLKGKLLRVEAWYSENHLHLRKPTVVKEVKYFRSP